jgi:hypothetical protein
MKNDKASNISRTFREKITELRCNRVFNALSKVIEMNNLTTENVNAFQIDNVKKFEKIAKKDNEKLSSLKENRVFSFLVSKELNVSLSTCNEELSEVCNLHNRAFVSSFFSIKDNDARLEIARLAHYKSQI